MEIIIGDFTFELKSKTVADNKGYITTHFQGDESYMNNPFVETRNKVMFESYPTGRNNEKKILYAYTSISELGLWRICYVQGETLLKFDNYTQATMLHLRLQTFINDNYDSLPFTTSEFTFSRRIISEDEPIFYVDIPEYNDSINPHGVIACTSPEEIDEELIQNRYIPFFHSSARTITSKSDYFVEMGFSLVSTDYLFELNVTLDNIHVIMEMYRVKVNTSEPESEIKEIIMEIGKYNITHTDEHRTGYYICNMIINDEINQYGLYSTYISGSANNPPRATEESYTSKPLEYITQAKKYKNNTTDTKEQNLNHPIYSYMGYRHQNIFPICQLSESKGGKKRKRTKKTKTKQKHSKKRKTRTIKNI
jgi:hypothetical protein